MKGFKVFKNDWTCQKFEYEVGKTYKLDGKLEICKNGFHFCKNLIDCFEHYGFSANNKVAEVEAIGNVINYRDIYCTDEIIIKREILWDEVFNIINFGKTNTGMQNSGNCNSGNCNYGSYNSGNCNYGSYNSGYFNNGNSNSGYHNYGNYNSGGYNIGSDNTGYSNDGIYNTGFFNKGDYNTGLFNKGDYNTGFFNTNSKVNFFNKEVDMDKSEIERIVEKIQSLFASYPISYTSVNFVEKNRMSKEEKNNNPSHERLGGYLKETEFNGNPQEWWDKFLTYSEKAFIENLPNFDADIFYETTGIRVKGEYQ